jgi:FlaA1/EpsC-like NDP-sugar epimerase
MLVTLASLRDFESVSAATYNGTSFDSQFCLEKPMQSENPNGQVRELPLRDLALEDLLGRKPVDWNPELIRERIQGKVVMVTGAAGSIGSELCRQIGSFSPRALVGFDQAETPLFLLERELYRKFPELVFHAEIGNITRFEDVARIMQEYRPSIVYHAAAYKHVPMMERHVFAALENNIFGTWHVARAAASHGVGYFVLISTDKAVRPTSVMGATKRVAELVIRALQQPTGTRFVAVRFGNVLGSSGSVVPIFTDQIAAGGPVTVTHPEMRRYFMTASEAAQLVLQAFVLGDGGEIFVLDMGEPVKIVDLARNLILLSGLQPEKDIKIEFTGVRPGEKLFEELNLQAENLVPTSHCRVSRLVSSDDLDARRIERILQELQNAANARDIRRAILLLKVLVPDYDPDSQLLENAMSTETNHIDAEQVQGPQIHEAEPLVICTEAQSRLEAP